MRLFVPAIALLLAAGAFGADRHKVDVDPESEDGILLQRIQQEPTAPRKLALLEKFVAQFPKATSIAWVYEQLLPIYADAKQEDKLLATAESLLAIDPQDLDSAHYLLRLAESRNDNEMIRKYATLSWDIGCKTSQIKKPTDPDDVPDWTRQIQFAKQVMAYSEYLLSVQVTQEGDQQKKAELIQVLETRNPQSQYLAIAKAPPPRVTFSSMSPDQAYALAEQGLPSDPDNEDFLMAIANHLLNREHDLPRVLSFSLRIIEVLQRKPKPDGVSIDDWERKRARYLGAANWMAGIVYGKQGRYGLSDRYLRASLGYIRDNVQALAAAYFYLGYDNYAMAGELHDRGRAVEAVRYSKLCTAIDGPFQSLAYKNLQVLRNEYNVE
jgi:tetratricopeptide (TPR) repeat protein